MQLSQPLTLPQIQEDLHILPHQQVTRHHVDVLVHRRHGVDIQRGREGVCKCCFSIMV